MTNSGDSVLSLTGIVKTFAEPSRRLSVLNNVNFRMRAGEVVLLEGPSGSGKTTLLQIAGCLRSADSGSVEVVGKRVDSRSEADLTDIRRKHLGFVFQQFHLIDALSVRNNVALGLRFKRQIVDETHIQALLAFLGIDTKADKPPGQLSGGEKQRVAFARALAGEPNLLLADEPTSQLDTQSAEAVMSLIQQSAKKKGIAVLIATHDPRLHSIADRVCTLKNGQLS